MVPNFLLKNHLSSTVQAAWIYEALKDLMHYVAQMVTLEKKIPISKIEIQNFFELRLSFHML